MDIEEKRIYAEKTGRTRVFVGSSTGVAAVSVSDDLVGEFGIEHRCTARDVAGAPGRVAVATDEDAILLGEDARAVGVGPTTAVGFLDGAVVAGTEDGRVVRSTPDGDSIELGTVDASIGALDGDLAGTDAGAYRIADGGLEPAGLDAVRDVSATGTPLAATADGLYRLGNGWMEALAGDATLVAADGDGRAHAVVDGTLYALDGSAGEPDDWRAVDLPIDSPPVGVAYGDGVYAATAEGTFLVDAGDGWRHHPLGLPDVVGCAVATPGSEDA